MDITAKELFNSYGWSYEYIKGDCCEDVIRCKNMNVKNSKSEWDIQFNLMTKIVVLNDDMRFIGEHIPKVILIQISELGWYEWLKTVK